MRRGYFILGILAAFIFFVAMTGLHLSLLVTLILLAIGVGAGCVMGGIGGNGRRGIRK